jgi:hypothetical protein
MRPRFGEQVSIVDSDGKLLLVSGGRYNIDLNTGLVVESTATPNSHPNYAEMCLLLAGLRVS